MNSKIDLSGKWSFCLDGEKRGLAEHFENKSFEDTINLPSTTAYAKKGEPNRARETYFLTECYKFEGYSWYKRSVSLPATGKKELKDKHFFLTLERTRISHVWVDGKYAGSRDSFIARHIYDLTGLIEDTSFEITVMVSNVDYKVPGGHMTSQDTQTNWNGILGEISLSVCDTATIGYASSACDFENKKALLNLEVLGFEKLSAKIKISADQCILKKSLLKADSDCSIFKERADKQQAEATDMEILEKYLDIEKDAIPVKEKEVKIKKGENRLSLDIDLPEDVKEWDEEEPYVYRINVVLLGEDRAKLSEKTLWFGYRIFKAAGDKFTINGRKTFLRGRHQGMLFPLSGFAPMNVTGWLKDFKIAKDFGLNHERCHTCTPPEAAFIAADLLGIYLQPEIPFWGTWKGEKDEGYAESKEAQDFLKEEGFSILKEFAGHPSFVMMSMGNELWGDKEFLGKLVGGYKAIRPDIMYTQGSNNFQWVPCILPEDDFFSGVRFSVDRQIRGSYAMCDAPLGRIQKSKPSTDWNYDEAINPSGSTKAFGEKSGEIEIQYGTGVKKVKAESSEGELIPKVPVVSHEIGQYFIYPDFREITHYTGVLQARNLQVFQERLEDKGLSKRAEGYFKSSGALAVDCYKNELEAALRSGNMAGFQILDIQDFSGQGTALVGPLNSLMENKGLISSEGWREFCSGAVILGEFASYVVTAGELFKLSTKLSYFKKKPLGKIKVKVLLVNKEKDKIVFEEDLESDIKGETGLFDTGSIKIKIPGREDIACYELDLIVSEGRKMICENHYTLWAYKKAEKFKISTDVYVEEDEGGQEISFPVTASGKVAITSDMVETDAAVDAGKSVLFYLTPNENRSLPGAYCTDFWNYPMFKSISESMNKPIPVGTLGLLIAKDHPAFAGFKCEAYTTPQWYEIVERSRASLLNWLGFRPLATVIDNCESNDNLGMIYEFLIMDGKSGPAHVIVCTSPLDKLTAEGCAPAAALQRSLLEYLESGETTEALKTNMQQLKRLAY